jgi:glutamine cyclotransferase
MKSKSLFLCALLVLLAARPSLAVRDALGNGSGPIPPPPSIGINSSGAILVRTCHSPVSGNDGLTWDGSFLWISDFDTKRAYQVDPATCTAVRSIPLPGDYPMGLAWDGQYLWHAAGFSRLIYRLDPADGHIVSSFSSPGMFPAGLTYTSGLWNADPNCNFAYCGPDNLYRLDLSGALLQTVPAPGGGYPTGLAYDGSSLWHSDNVTGLIYKMNPGNLGVIDMFSAPGPYPNDLTWDGHHLWVVDNGTDMLYEYDVSATTPARSPSWGRLKLLYR